MKGPEHYREAERLMKQGDEWMDADLGWKASLSVDDRLARRTADLLAAQVHATLAQAAAQSPAASGAQLETEPAVAYVYRAEWGPVQLDTYTISDAAREHCEADALNNSPEYEGGIFEWLGDESEPDAPYELLIAKNGEESTTDYTVTRIEVASEYDPEADA